MLRKTLTRLLIIQIFINSVHKLIAEENIEVTVELGTKEELLLGIKEEAGNETLNEANSGNKQSNEENGEIQQSNEENGETKQINEDNNANKQTNEENSENKDLNQEDTRNQVDTHELLQKFREKKPPLWKVKENTLEKKQEPGFDLSPEEMQKFKIWKDGVIPYYIDGVSFSDKVLRSSIRSFLQLVNTITSLSFVELPNAPSNDNERWVFFINRRGLLGCADHTVRNFTNQGVQQVVLGYDCMAIKGELAEAVMSIVGVPAQHNAPDRDKYINVNMENIMPDKKYMFEKLRDNEWLFHDLEYDFDSITHYDINKYSVNGRATIELKNDSTDIDPAKQFSKNDLLKIKMLYNYITKNKKLNAPECHKLFKPRNKFERFVPLHDAIKPRKKPSRYTGLANNTVENDNVPNDGENEEKEDEAGDGENEGKKVQSREKNDGEEVKVKFERLIGKNTKKKYKEISKLDALEILSDYHTGSN